MSFQAIRAHIESRVFTAFQNLNPPLEVMFDNVQDPSCVALRRLHHLLHRHRDAHDQSY